MNDRVGTYRLGRPLGHGGMAEVFAATHLGAGGFERPVCVKRILPHIASDPEFRQMFLQEVRLVGALCHGNLVQVFDCVEEKQQLSLVMELVDGMDLKAFIRALAAQGRAAPAGLVVYIAGQLLAGLRYAHGRRVVHRDISPHNLLLSAQGEVKIADFGVAKALLTHATRTGVIRGKLAYMSPEQAKTEPVDQRTDLYSAGLVLYELITGERLFRARTPWQLLSAVTSAERPTLDNVEPELARVVEQLLEPDPDRRFSSAEEALTALPPWEALGPLGASELTRFLTELEPQSPAEHTPPLEPTADLDPEATADERPKPVCFELGPVIAASPQPAALPPSRRAALTAEHQKPRRFDRRLPATMELEALDVTTAVTPNPDRRPLLLLTLLSAALILALGLSLGVILRLSLNG